MSPTPMASQDPKKPISAAERQRIYRAKKAAQEKQQQSDSKTGDPMLEIHQQPSSQSVPSSTSTTERKPMTPAERQRISRAKKTVQSPQELQVDPSPPDQSSQSDSGELPSPQYVPLHRQDFLTPAIPNKKPMTNAEKLRASRARETEDQTQRRLENKRRRSSASRET